MTLTVLCTHWVRETHWLRYARLAGVTQRTERGQRHALPSDGVVAGRCSGVQVGAEWVAGKCCCFGGFVGCGPRQAALRRRGADM